MKNGVLTHLLDLANELHSLGIKVSIAIKKDQRRNNRRLNNYASLTRNLNTEIPIHFFYGNDLYTFAKKSKVDLIHAHARLTYSSALSVSERLNVPLVITIHGVYPWQKTHPSALAHSKKIIAIGSAQADSVGLEYKQKIAIIPNGIDLEKFKPLAITNNLDEPLKILWYGRTDEKTSRGLRILNQTIKILRDQGVKIEANKVGVNNSHSITEFISRPWIDNPLPLLQKHQVAFGHSRSLREAMACGNVGFLLGYGYGGKIDQEWFRQDKKQHVDAIPEYKLPLPTPERIAEDLKLLADNRDYLLFSRIEARDTALKYFDVKNMVSETLEVYKECVE